MEEEVLSVRDLAVDYRLKNGRIRACEGISFSLRRGEGLGIVGESACGKTTVALSLIQLLPDNGEIAQGEILLNGRDIAPFTENDLRKVRMKEISIVFQGAMNALNPVRRVGDQIMEAIRAHYSLTERECRRKTEEIFSQVEIDPKRIKEYPHEFSGGMKQRVMIAMALSCDPQVIIGDEPTTALDVMVQAQILQLLEDLRQERGMGLILISHDLSVVGETCEKMAVMYAGRMIEIGSTEAIFQNPSHPYTEALLSAFPDIKGDGRLAPSIVGSPPSLMNPPRGCRFYPRCSQGKTICQEKDPPLVHLEKDHYSFCHLLRE